MRDKDVIAYLCLWKKLNNENFKGHEFTTFENLAGEKQLKIQINIIIRKLEHKGSNFKILNFVIKCSLEL